MNINWREWDLVISASQVETWDSCRRKWWLSKVARMPELDKGFQIYGNVIHGVAERFFEADDRGYDTKTGKPVDLYPEGWQKSYDRVNKTKLLGEVSLQEQAQIKLLVKRAIEEGIWVRMPNREVEASFFRKVAERVAIIGYIDLLTYEEVHDHKSTKNMRYAKSAADLKENTQLLIYAHECFERADEAGRPLDRVLVRHNTFSKDPKNPVVQATHSYITRAEADKFWASVQERAGEMRKLKRAGIAPENWIAVPGPKTADACNAYGGCAFRTICGKVETPQKYLARIELAQKAQQDGASTLTSTGKTEMGIFDKMKTSAAGVPAAPAPVAPKAAPAPAPSTPQPTKEELENKGLHPEQQAAPWARATCKGCKGMGLTKQGAPCRVCDTLNKKDGLPTSAAWTLSTTDAGLIVWTDASGAQGSTPAVAEPKVADRTSAAHAPQEAAQEPAGGALAKKGRRGRKKAEEPAPAQPQPEPAPEAAPETDETEGEAPGATEAPAAGKPGRRPQGFTLLIGALPERAKTTGVIGLDQEFDRWGSELAKEMGAESYFALDAYKRRDWMAMRAAQIAETFGSKIVTAIGESPDFLEFLAAIKPHASYVYVGCR